MRLRTVQNSARSLLCIRRFKPVVVLVSGASGYLGCHCVDQLLREGYKVRGTVRSLKNEDKVCPIRDLCPEAADRLDLVEADLLKPDTWPNAVKGCDFVLHTASPFPSGVPNSEEELIKPAVDGTVNVLKACAQEPSVKRVVLTSSVAAIIVGYPLSERQTKVFTENDWTKTDGPHVSAYEKSKTLAEQAAWDFVKNIKDGENKFELTTICPAFIIGPMLHKTECTSAQVIKRLMHHDMPMIPRVNFGTVDVRDVALSHIRAMRTPDAAGQRFILSERSMWLKDMAHVLLKEFGPFGYKIPTREAPYPLLWIVREVLGMDPLRRSDQAFVDMGYSLIERGIVKKSDKYQATSQGQTQQTQSS